MSQHGSGNLDAPDLVNSEGISSKDIAKNQLENTREAVANLKAFRDFEQERDEEIIYGQMERF